MVTFDKDYKALNVPSGLGVPTGNETVSGVTEEEVEQMIDSALTPYSTTEEVEGMLQDYATTAVTSDLQAQISAITPGSQVQWDQQVSAGTKIATVTIDGTPTDVYAPEGGQGGVTPEQVQAQIESALTPYSTSQQVTQEIGEALVPYSTTADTREAVSSALTDYYTKTQTDGKYATTATTESIQSQVDTLTGRTEEVAQSASTVYTEIFYEDESGNTQSVISDLQESVEGLGQDLEVVQSGLTALSAVTATKSTVSVRTDLTGGTAIAQIIVDGEKTVLYTPEGGGGGGGDYVIVSDLGDIEEPVEGAMYTVEGQEVDVDVYSVYFDDYNSFTGGNTFVTIKRDSDDEAIKYITFGDGWFSDVENDGVWHSYLWGGIKVRVKADRSDGSPENASLLIQMSPDIYIEAGEYVNYDETTDTQFLPAKTYVYTNETFIQLGRSYEWADIATLSGSTLSLLCDEIRLQVNIGVLPTIHYTNDGFNCILPWTKDSGTWLDFEAVETRWGGAYVLHLYMATDGEHWNGTDGDPYRIDTNQLGEPPGPSCIYCDPNGDLGWMHTGCSKLFDEGTQPYLAVKGCELDFSAEYGWGSIVYARKWKDQNDQDQYKWCLIVPTDTGVYKGVWSSTNPDDENSTTRDSWTAWS